MDCGADRYRAVAVRERLEVSKQTTDKFHMEMFSLKDLKEVQGKEQYPFGKSHRFAALENLDDAVDIKGAWET